MTTPDDKPAPEHLWWSQGDESYYRWDGVAEAPAEGPRLRLMSLAGTIREVEAARLTRIERDAVAAVLLPMAKESLGRIGKTLAALDPAFDRDWDFEALVRSGPELENTFSTLRRLVARIQASPEVLEASVEAVREDATTLWRILAFGHVGIPIIEQLGAERAPNDAAWPPPEAPDVMVARVRADVRAELDALAASRPPMSFDFEELAKASGDPPTKGETEPETK